jgi:hypothetical protein
MEGERIAYYERMYTMNASITTALDLVNHIATIAKVYTREDRRATSKARDMDRADKRSSKRRIHTYTAHD